MILNRTITAFGLALACSSLALAQDETEAPAAPATPTVTAALTLTLESSSDIERTSATYLCDNEQALQVHYINAAPNFLAIVPVDGQSHIFATTISASGARYVSGPFEWWSKGGEGTLRELTQGEDAEPMLTCTSATETP